MKFRCFRGRRNKEKKSAGRKETPWSHGNILGLEPELASACPVPPEARHVDFMIPAILSDPLPRSRSPSPAARSRDAAHRPRSASPAPASRRASAEDLEKPLPGPSSRERGRESPMPWTSSTYRESGAFDGLIPPGLQRYASAQPRSVAYPNMTSRYATRGSGAGWNVPPSIIVTPASSEHRRSSTTSSRDLEEEERQRESQEPIIDPVLRVLQELNDGGLNWIDYRRPSRKTLRGDPAKPGALSHVNWGSDTHLSEGGFGRVYPVTYYGRRCALKVQPWSDQASTELKWLRCLGPHPSLVPLLAYSTKSKICITLSPLAVCDLYMVATLLRGIGRELIPYVLASIWRGLSYLHARMIAHRDVCDGNVLIMPDGTPVLTDFGFADRFRKDGECLRRAFEVRYLATTGYKAPEVVRDWRSGPAMDLWGLGVIMCRLVNGTIPFDHMSRTATPLARIHLLRGLDLRTIYGFSQEEHAVVDACFTEFTGERIQRVNAVMQTAYFADVSMEAIDSGFRQNPHHARMRELLQRYRSTKAGTSSTR